MPDLLTQFTSPVACVASVYVRFRKKERGTRVKYRGKNGASKRAGRGEEERKEKANSLNFYYLVLVDMKNTIGCLGKKM